MTRRELEVELAVDGWTLVHYEDGGKKEPRYRAHRNGTDQAADSPELLLFRCRSYDESRSA